GSCASLTLPDQVARPGQMVIAGISFASEGQAVSGIQFDIEWDQGVDVQATVGPLVGQSAKALYGGSPADHLVRYLIVGINQNRIADGEVIRLFLSIDPAAPPGASQVRVTHAAAVTPDGDAVTLQSSAAAIQIQSGSAPPALDPQAVLNAASLL